MTKPVAVLMLRDRPPWPRNAIYRRGLEATGYDVQQVDWMGHVRHRPRPGDVLVIWNRFSLRDVEARRFEAAGARVIVTENGWIGEAPHGGKLYALSLSQHNGGGFWHEGEGDRLAAQGVTFAPWRTSGEHVLVLPSRGIGPSSLAMPRDWPDRTMKRLKALTGRPLRLRLHPGQNDRPLGPDLAGAHCVVTWASGAAIKALAAGVPAFHEFPRWIGAGAARLGFDDLEMPFLADRLPTFRRLAWAQWSADEIASGEAFAWLLQSMSCPASAARA